MKWNEGSDTPRRVKSVATRGYVSGIDQSGKLQRARVVGWSGTENEGIDHAQPHGFTSNPGGGDKVEAIMLDIGGDASHRVVISIMGDRAKHLQVPAGHAALYAPGDPTQAWHATPDGLSANAPGKPISVSGASFNMTVSGGATINGGLNITGGLTVDGRTI